MPIQGYNKIPQILTRSSQAAENAEEKEKVDIKKVDAKRLEQKENNESKSTPPQANLERTEIISRINKTWDLGIKISQQFSERLFEQGKEVYKQSKLTQEEKNTISASTQADPLAFNKGLKDFAVTRIAKFIDEDLKKKHKLDDATTNTAKKIMTQIKEKGSFSARDFALDKEAFETINNTETLKKVLFVLQEGTDNFMEEAKLKLSDPRRSVQQKAQETLNIATAVVEAEKQIRILELNKQSEQVQGRRTIYYA